MDSELAEIVERLEAVEPLAAEQLRALKRRLRGEPPLLIADARRQRDEMLCRYRKRWNAKVASEREAARLIARDIGRYMAGADWRRDRLLASCPEELVGTRRGDAWAILKAMPESAFPSVERLRKILGQAAI